MYTFDPRPQAKATLKERMVWMIYLGALFFLLYGSANSYAQIHAPHPSLFMEWETRIPFIEAFIVPYMSSDVLFCIAFLMPYTRSELRILAARVLFIVLVSTAFFVALPLQFSFDKPEILHFNILFAMLQADLPYNQLPSLHIGFAIVLWASIRPFLTHKLAKILLAGWFWLIALSTLFVYQHHFIDIPTGALTGLLACYLIRDKRESFLTKGFTTPRSLKMALYYFGGAALCLFGAFWFDGAALLFVWLFASLLAVSLIYAFGMSEVICSEGGKPNIWQWLLFLPYFAGNYLSWMYYRRKLPLMTHVDGHVYMGRLPASGEYERLKSAGISRVINLAMEQQGHKAGLPQDRFGFLDQTIPSPQALHRAVEKIQSEPDSKVYVHCALGLSRSVLVVAAWLLYRGFSYEEVLQRLGQIRPGYVRSPYMQVSLELYQHYLAEKW